MENMERESILLEIARLEVQSKQNFEIIKDCQTVIQANGKRIDDLRKLLAPNF